MALENQASSDRAGYRIPGADHRKWPCRSRSRAVVHLLRGWSGHLLEVNLAWTGLMPSLVVAAGRAKSPSGNDIAYSKTRLLSSFIFGLFSRTSAVTTTPWRILATAISCYCPDFRRNSRTKTFFFPWDNRNW